MMRAFALVTVWACLNHYGKLNAHREEVQGGGHDFYVYAHRLRQHPEHDAIVAAPPPKEPAADADFKVRNDYAVLLIRRGESPKAVEILEAIEKEKPGEYMVAANLGTAYELSGNLEKAYHWIGEGLRRNPKAHEASEWLHLKILEARQAVAKDPEWVKSHGVLDLDFGAEAVPKKPTTWPKDSGDAEGVIKALTYQLSERTAFVKPPDALVGGMIADLADLLSIYRSVDHAIPVYELAQEYQAPKAALLKSRLAASLSVRNEEARRYRDFGTRDWRTPVIVVALGVLAIALVLWIRRRGGVV